jgi:hypothetical protein
MDRLGPVQGSLNQNQRGVKLGDLEHREASLTASDLR